jgi:hypothetical protein
MADVQVAGKEDKLEKIVKENKRTARTTATDPKGKKIKLTKTLTKIQN